MKRFHVFLHVGIIHDIFHTSYNNCNIVVIYIYTLLIQQLFLYYVYITIPFTTIVTLLLFSLI